MLAPDIVYFFHGRAASEVNFHNAGKVLPRIRSDTAFRAGALFSPVFHPRLQGSTVKWIDLYDDWSLAPDINPVNRLTSKLSYRSIRNNHRNIVVTCNSLYMAGMLGLPRESVVPNGVDERLGDIQRSGSNAERLIILGHFFKGRTDYDLIIRIAQQRIFKEIVFGSPGNGGDIQAAIRECRQYAEVTVSNWLDNEALANLSGPCTAALIPHVVNDYTLSQDLMKVYQFLALGIKVICPIELWPPHLLKTYAFLTGIGVILDPNLREWLCASYINDTERRLFAVENSWKARAHVIRQKLEALDAD